MGWVRYGFVWGVLSSVVLFAQIAHAEDAPFSSEFLALRSSFSSSGIIQKEEEVPMNVWWDCLSWFGKSGSSGFRERKAYFRFERYSKTIIMNVGSNSVSLFKLDPKVGFIGNDPDAGLKVVLRYNQQGWIVEFSAIPQLFDEDEVYMPSTVDPSMRVLNYMTCKPRASK